MAKYVQTTDCVNEISYMYFAVYCYILSGHDDNIANYRVDDKTRSQLLQIQQQYWPL